MMEKLKRKYASVKTTVLAWICCRTSDAIGPEEIVERRTKTPVGIETSNVTKFDDIERLDAMKGTVQPSIVAPKGPGRLPLVRDFVDEDPNGPSPPGESTKPSSPLPRPQQDGFGFDFRSDTPASTGEPHRKALLVRILPSPCVSEQAAWLT